MNRKPARRRTRIATSLSDSQIAKTLNSPQRSNGGPVPSYVRFGGTLWLWRATWRAAATFLLSMLLVSCRQSAQEPVTLSYFRLGWSQRLVLPAAERLSQQFTRETGVYLKSFPVPETTLDQLDLSRKLLESGSGPDVLGIDLIWSGVLEEDLLDLRPYLAAEISLLEPKLLPSYNVGGKLWRFLIKFRSGSWSIEPTFSANTVMTILRARGTNLRGWPRGSRQASA